MLNTDFTLVMTPKDYRKCHEDTKHEIETCKTNYLRKKKKFLESLTCKEHNIILEEIIKSYSWGKAIRVGYNVHISDKNSEIIGKMWKSVGWNVSIDPGMEIVIDNVKGDTDNYDQEIFQPYKAQRFNKSGKAPIWVTNALIVLKDHITITIYDRDIETNDFETGCNKHDRQMWILDQLALRSY